MASTFEVSAAWSKRVSQVKDALLDPLGAVGQFFVHRFGFSER